MTLLTLRWWGMNGLCSSEVEYMQHDVLIYRLWWVNEWFVTKTVTKESKYN